MPYATEKAWAVALAREVASDLPNAIANVPGITLNTDQIATLQLAFTARLVRTMGEDADETPAAAAARNIQPE
ncbi:MAG TPA: hypothetical protein VJA94_20210 [Candidatus Angelobacter sp.]